MSTLGIGRYSYSMILPDMKDGLGLTYTQTGLIATANFVGYSLFTLISGILAARYGIRNLISLSLLLISLTIFLTGLSWSFEAALIFRFLTGIGSGGANTPTMVLNTMWFGPHLRGLATGIMVTGNGIALILEGFLIPEILRMYGGEGWRFSWIYLGVIVLGVSALSYLLIRGKPEEKGLNLLEKSSRRRDPKESLRVEVYRNPFKSLTFYHLGAVFLIFGFTQPVYATFFPVYLSKEAGLSIELAGWLWSVVGTTSIVSGFLWGAVSDRIGRGKSLGLVYVTLAASFALFVGPRDVAGFFLSSVLFGVGIWAPPTIVSAAVGDFFGPRYTAQGLAFMNSVFFGLGQIAGPWVAGYIADATGSFHAIYVICVLILVMGSIFALFIRSVDILGE